jgi:hypothetical protein
MTRQKALSIGLFLLSAFAGQAQTILKVSGGGTSVSKGNIDGDILAEIIQQKQEEVFTRLFQNIVVDYFNDGDPQTGLYNFPVYYSIHNIVSDLTIGKSKTTVSKAVINSMTEFAFIYGFVKYYQQNLSANEKKKIENAQYVTNVTERGRVKVDPDNIILLNYYLEAAFDVLANDDSIQKKFKFTHPISSTEIKSWYEYMGMLNSNQKDEKFKDVDDNENTLIGLRDQMKLMLPKFIEYINSSNTNNYLQIACSISKTSLGLENVNEKQIIAVKLLLNEFAYKVDFLFDRNVPKQLFNLLVENTHFGADESGSLKEVYVDVESLILSLDKEFVGKQKNNPIATRCYFINPRPFITIGTSVATFIDNENKLDLADNGTKQAIKNITFANEKIGFRVTVYDRGYTSSFAPGETYKWHGKNYTWKMPQKKPIVNSVYYNFYASGLLYNVLDLKTNKNFNYGFVGSNVGLRFFNGLELSAGMACIWDGGLDTKNTFAKFDFDVPIVDYLMALRKKKK